MSFLYRISVSALSMTTSGIRRPHIMPHQNTRKPPPYCTCCAVRLSRSAWPDCLQTRLWRLSGWRHMRHSSMNRTWCQFWQVHSACCWAHLYRAALCLVVKWDLAMDVGSEVHHAAYFVQFESKPDVLWLHEKHYCAWCRYFQGSSELKSVTSGHQLQ